MCLLRTLFLVLFHFAYFYAGARIFVALSTKYGRSVCPNKIKSTWLSQYSFIIRIKEFQGSIELNGESFVADLNSSILSSFFNALRCLIGTIFYDYSGYRCTLIDGTDSKRHVIISSRLIGGFAIELNKCDTFQLKKIVTKIQPVDWRRLIN